MRWCSRAGTRGCSIPGNLMIVLQRQHKQVRSCDNCTAFSGLCKLLSCRTCKHTHRVVSQLATAQLACASCAIVRRTLPRWQAGSGTCRDERRQVLHQDERSVLQADEGVRGELHARRRLHRACRGGCVRALSAGLDWLCHRGALACERAGSPRSSWAGTEPE